MKKFYYNKYYTADEIVMVLGMKASAVRKRLDRAHIPVTVLTERPRKPKGYKGVHLEALFFGHKAIIEEWINHGKSGEAEQWLEESLKVYPK